jgi:hypothetical protein
MVRLRPRVNVRTGGGEEGAFGRSSAACAQASQSGLWSRPAKGVGSRLRLGGGGVGGSIVGEPRVGALGHTPWSSYGRNAGYPTSPVQTRTCSVPASGSSVARASVQKVTVSRDPLMARARREGGASDSGPPCPGCVAFPGGVLPSSPAPCGRLSLPLRPRRDTTPQTPTAGVPVASPSPPAWRACRLNGTVPASCGVRGSPCVPTERSPTL